MQLKDWIILYYVVVLAYSLYVFKLDRWQGIYRLLILSLFPVLGTILIFFLNHTRQSTTDSVQTVDLDYITADSPEDILKIINYQREMNVVPIQEALVLNDSKTKRSLLIDALRNDILSQSTFLQKALRDKDTETSHYAASAMFELLRQLTLALQDLAVKYDKNPDDLESSIAYADALAKYISSGMMDSRTVREYQYLRLQVLDNLIRLAPEESQYFIDKIECTLELKEYDKALIGCDHFMNKHGHNNEKPYLLYMKTYYMLHDEPNFRIWMEKLRIAPISLTYTGLSILRFWIGERDISIGKSQPA
ncbi:MAG: hypothetical protein ACM3MK_07090 [Chitinophagales bacterium]